MKAAPSPGRRTATGAPVRIEGLAHSFGELRAIERIDLEAEAGEVVGIVGPSGCGKTTLLELVAGLRPADAGQIVGRRGDRGRRSASSAAPTCRSATCCCPGSPRSTTPALALRIAGAARGGGAASGPAPHFERLGLAGFERARPGELSGGMRQRVAFLRTLMAGRPVLLLDEPFASLDAITRAEMQSWLASVLGPTSRTRSCSSPTTSRRPSISPIACSS